MRKILFSVVAVIVCHCLLSLTASAQFTHKIKADSVRIYNDNCDAELILENGTRNISGFLFNRGNGRTEFKKILHRVNDSLFVIGGDTMLIRLSYAPESGSVNYIWNGIAPQTANINITGNGVFGGTLNAAGTVTATSFSGTGTNLTGMAAGLSIGGNAATATLAGNSYKFGGIPQYWSALATTVNYALVYDDANSRFGFASPEQMQTFAGGPFLPLTAGSSKPLSGDLYMGANRSLVFNTVNTRVWENSGALNFRTGGDDRYMISASGDHDFKLGSATFSNIVRINNNTLHANATETNTVFNGSLGNGNTANIVFTDGYSAMRAATNHSLNIDVYNSGSPVAAATFNQNGSFKAGNVSGVTNQIGTVSMGFSGGGYPVVGYNVGYTGTPNSYTAVVTDYVWALDMGNSNAFRLRYALGAGEAPVSFTDFITVANSGAVTLAASLYTGSSVIAGGGIFPGYNNGYVGSQSSYYISGNTTNSGIVTNGNFIVAGNYAMVANRTQVRAGGISDLAGTGNDIGIALGPDAIYSTNGVGNHAVKNLGSSGNRWGDLYASSGNFSGIVNSQSQLGLRNTHAAQAGNFFDYTGTGAWQATVSAYNNTFNIYDETAGRSIMSYIRSTNLVSFGSNPVHTNGTGTFGGVNVTGNVTAASLIKSGGTSSQFLKADGSTDNSIYLTTGSAASTYLPLTAGSASALSDQLYLTHRYSLARNNGSAGTDGAWYTIENSGGVYLNGVDNSSGAQFVGVPYSYNFYLPASRSFVISQGGSIKYQIDGSGNNMWSGAGTFSGIVNSQSQLGLRSTHAGQAGNLFDYTGTGAWQATVSAYNNTFNIYDETAGRSIMNYIRSTNLVSFGSNPIHTSGTATFANLVRINSNTLLANATETNTVFNGSVGNGNTANIVFTDGYSAMRAAANHSLNIDVYNSGSPVAAATFNQNGSFKAGNVSGVTNQIGTVSMGLSGGGYPVMGYNVGYTGTPNSYTAVVTDYVWALDMGNSNAFRLRYASGTGGTPVSFADFITVANTGAVTIASSLYTASSVTTGGGMFPGYNNFSVGSQSEHFLYGNTTNGGIATTGNFIVAGTYAMVANRTKVKGGGIYDLAGTGNDIGIALGAGAIYSTDGSGNYAVKNLGSSGNRWGDLYASLGNFSSHVTATAFFESSDLTQKTVLNRFPSTDGIDAIDYTFNPTGQRKYGYGAQEVAEVIPSAVITGDDGKLKVDYNSVHTYKIAMLEQEIREMRVEIAKLKKQ